MSEKAQKKSGGRLWLLGFLIILFCLSGAVGGVILSLAFDSRNGEPVGTIVASNNVVQRRSVGNALWDRLTVGSPIYEGDTIRTADLASTTLYIKRNSLDVNEKTFISIQRSPEDEDSILIYLDEGNLVITTAPGGGQIALNLMGRQVEAAPGTVLSASSGKDGAIVQVSEGSATLTGEKGEKWEIASGTMVALYAWGVEQELKAAMLMQPQPEVLPICAFV
jgi:hypothetical protein